jgi:hypothetical protein
MSALRSCFQPWPSSGTFSSSSLNFSVFDVMLHSISPTRREAASPHSPRRGSNQMQLHAGSCSYKHKLAVTSTNLQLHRQSAVTIWALQSHPGWEVVHAPYPFGRAPSRDCWGPLPRKYGAKRSLSVTVHERSLDGPALSKHFSASKRGPS